MRDAAPGGARRSLDRLSHLSPPALAIVGVLIVAGVSGGGYYAYKTYDYVQHDNDFCMSCHLMAEPYELFAESAHRDLGCKACHRPSILQRSQMGLTGVLLDPDSISTHANVPNEICAECHIQGDPEKWRLIANTVGHKVHLESQDSVLQGLQCVECHSTSLHEFAPIDRTCAQSQCHADKSVQLGAMSNLTIHCAACHNFVAPVGEASLLGSPEDAAILPDYDECLSCHAMRTLVEMPDPDPHEGGCAACHNPHEQTTPEEAGRSCATAGCHENAGELTPFHRGLATETLTDCMYCHRAHDFALEGTECASCHVGADTPPDVVSGDLPFAHGDHDVVACGSCHASTEAHGRTTVRTVADCRSCHHTRPVSQPCATCHVAGDAPTETYTLIRPMRLSVGVDDPRRVMSFPHEVHATTDCATCHNQGIDMGVPDDLECQSCHEEHHTPSSDCASCHRVAPASAHPPTEAHVTCSGAGCHTTVPFDTVPRTRAFCLGCHQDLRDHEAGRVCADCHTLPAPRARGTVP